MWLRKLISSLKVPLIGDKSQHSMCSLTKLKRCVSGKCWERRVMGSVWEAGLQPPDRREEAYTVTCQETHIHTPHHALSSFLSSHQRFSPLAPQLHSPRHPHRQFCQVDSSKLRGKWVLLALQLRGTDSISAIWNWARGVESGRQRQRAPLSEAEGELHRRH